MTKRILMKSNIEVLLKIRERERREMKVISEGKTGYDTGHLLQEMTMTPTRVRH